MNKRSYDVDRPFLDILHELAYRVRWAVTYRLGTWTHNLHDRVWCAGPNTSEGIRFTVWSKAVDLTAWLAFVSR